MQLFASWKNYILLLTSKQLMLLLGAMWLAIVRCYQVLWGRWWWLLSLLCVATLLCGPVVVTIFDEPTVGLSSLVGFPLLFLLLDRTSSCWSYSFLGSGVLLLLYTSFIFIVYLCARPASVLKTYIRYFFEYWRHFFFFVCWFFLVRVVSIPLLLSIGCIVYWYEEALLSIGSHHASIAMPIVAAVMFFLSIVVMTVCMGLITFWTFFFLDSRGGLCDAVRSFSRSLKMSIIGLPMMAFFLGFSYGVVRIMMYCMALMCSVSDQLSAYRCIIHAIVYIAVVPSVIAICAVVYTKCLYDNSALYLR